MRKKRGKFKIEEFIKKDKKDKKKYIIFKSKKIRVPSNIIKELHTAYKYKEVLNKFIVEYISKIKEKSYEDSNSKILNLINNFKKNYIEKVMPSKLLENPKNLYHMSGATDFSQIQLLLRSLSTTMGNFWEKIALTSNLAISTEVEFGIKITGIDIIFIENKKPTYAQIKTMEGTLTGSQKPRSEKELLLHQNKYFVAVFETGSGWTFHSDKIKKLKGKEFWSLINLDYDYILKEVKLMIKEIQDAYYQAKPTKN